MTPPPTPLSWRLLPEGQVPAWLLAVLGFVTLLAIAVPLVIVANAPRIAPVARKVARAVPPARVIPPAELPPVEPAVFVALAPQEALAYNASIPFSSAPLLPARPFKVVGDEASIARATDCLTAGVLYEAGDDTVGQRAVAQVILNRVRHPAFPKTVCGVVFQGSERSTGCQFTFTCDGALARTPSAAAWSRAREIAIRALRGDVYKPVGWATHYHTDWVVPYWSSSLDKIAAVDTHLFFRWTGWWGTGGAFNRNQLPGEGPVGKLAALSEAHRTGAVLADADAAIVEETPFFGRTPMPLASDPNTFLTMLNPAQAATFAGMAQASCGERVRCKFMGWTEPDAMAFTMPLTPDQMNAMSFSYIRDRASGLERTLWNCTEFKQRTPCMKRFTVRAMPVAEPAAGPAELEGVRRKTMVAEPPVGNTASPE